MLVRPGGDGPGCGPGPGFPSGDGPGCSGIGGNDDPRSNGNNDGPGSDDGDYCSTGGPGGDDGSVRLQTRNQMQIDVQRN